ncbi:sensor histidine kinase YesM [Saonia flava]|uniref:Sensor histidine kinase YesM n=1 Tax=Saonia flava TaxID=523696 RepID=A0A846R226_9FLAO|nr:sensor histidine kinase [Saonia flava]NJB71434.1 sensor histidine kinase YesM [Saonia flava]
MAFHLQRHKKTLIHISFWCVYASVFLYRISTIDNGEETNWPRTLKDFSFHMSVTVILSYLNYYIFLPRFLKDRNLKRYVFQFFPIFLGLWYFLLLGKRYIIDGFTHNREWMYEPRFIIQLFFGAIFVVIFVGLLKFVEDWFELESRKKKLENEQLASELRFLKAQINPHFLFNTLNNLYYLAFTKSPNTTEVIAKLSDMMRYMMYDSNHFRVPLEKEIEYIKNYIGLEKLRMDNKVKINLKLEGNTSGVSVAPLIFITFLENAFKHGVSNSDTQSWVEVFVKIDGKKCLYTVKNGKISESNKTVKEKYGIGLKNVKRRLDLNYEDNYELKVQDIDDCYCVELKLNLE